MSVVDPNKVVTFGDLATLNFTVLKPYDGTVPTGGDSFNENLNVFYTVCAGPGEANPYQRCVLADALFDSRVIWHGS